MTIAARKHGFAVIKSIDKFPPGKLPSKEEALEYIKKAGADLIFTTYQPGYYTTDKTYFLASDLFDATTETLIWSAQSEVYNPSNIEKTSKKYTDMMLEKLEKDGILIPAKKLTYKIINGIRNETQFS